MSKIFFSFHITFIVLLYLYHFSFDGFSFSYLFFPKGDYLELSYEKRKIRYSLSLDQKISYTLLSILNGPQNPLLNSFFSEKVELLHFFIHSDKLILLFDNNFFPNFRKQSLNKQNLFLNSILFSIFLSFDEINTIKIYIHDNETNIPLTKSSFRRESIYKENKIDMINFFLRRNLNF